MSDSAGALFDQLVEIMRRLRAPDGCPWDREQTIRTLRPYVLEETYELLDALDREDHDAIREELGDFLLEAVFLAQICDDEGHFSIGDSIRAISEKLVRRHPHVFDSESLGTLTPRQVKEKWEDIKAKEREQDGAKQKTLLSGIPRSLPSLLRAYELSTRAATVGFDWVKPGDVIEKIEEEVRELREAVENHGARSHEAEEELGDLFFAMANLARKMGIEPEAALRVANDKFQRRFDALEANVGSDGKQMKELTLDQLEERWQAVKRRGHEGQDNTKDTKDTKDTKQDF